MLTTVHIDPLALLALVAAAVLYGLGVRRVVTGGGAWSGRRTASFYLFGLGSYAVATLGFLGGYSATLRWAFVLRLALLLLVIPTLVAFGRPIELLRAATTGASRRRVDTVLGSLPIRLLGNAIVAPLVPFALFMLLLTPVAAFGRVTAPGQAVVTVLIPLLGLLMSVSLLEENTARTSTFYVAEFMIAFVELVLDAIPGILMRLATAVLDKAPALAAPPVWNPNPLRDQQLAGDLLWVIAEVGDLPVLVLLITRWLRSDRKEARSVDDLSDEAYADLMQQHLRAREPD